MLNKKNYEGYVITPESQQADIKGKTVPKLPPKSDEAMAILKKELKIQ
jgi:hypothetical protein